MRRLFAVILFGIILASASMAQTFGISTGANFQRLTDISIENIKSEFQSQTGWHVGAWVELPLGPAALRGGARYMSAGQLLEGLRGKDPSVPIRDNFDISVVELYLLLRLGLPSAVVSPYVFAGPVFRIPANTDSELNNDLKVLSYAGEVGAGLEINLGLVDLYPEVAYAFGITRFIEDEVILNFISMSIGDSQKLNVAMVRLSVGL